jgi:hypothetical protein
MVCGQNIKIVYTHILLSIRGGKILSINSIQSELFIFMTWSKCKNEVLTLFSQSMMSFRGQKGQEGIYLERPV